MSLSQIDRDALALAIEVAQNESTARRGQIESMLVDQPWQAVAEFCATCSQGRSLGLKPWQISPADFHPSDLQADWRRGGQAALELLQRMERCAVSKWHPDPVAACEAAERASPA